MKLTIGQRTSDFIAALVRSWYFVVFQSLFVGGWIFLNQMNILIWDKYPFEILKIVLAVEASFTASMVLMSQYRQAQIDRKVAAEDFEMDCQTKKEVDDLYKMVKRLGNQKKRRKR